jgi:hypothetical protein
MVMLGARTGILVAVLFVICGCDLLSPRCGDPPASYVEIAWIALHWYESGASRYEFSEVATETNNDSQELSVWARGYTLGCTLRGLGGGGYVLEQPDQMIHVEGTGSTATVTIVWHLYGPSKFHQYSVCNASNVPIQTIGNVVTGEFTASREYYETTEGKVTKKALREESFKFVLDLNSQPENPAEVVEGAKERLREVEELL